MNVTLETEEEQSVNRAMNGAGDTSKNAGNVEAPAAPAARPQSTIAVPQFRKRGFTLKNQVSVCVGNRQLQIIEMRAHERCLL